MKDFYNENFRPLKKEIETNTRKCKDIPSSWIGRVNNVKMTIFTKTLFTDLLQSQSKSPQYYSQKYKNKHAEICMEAQKILESQKNPKQEELPFQVSRYVTEL